MVGMDGLATKICCASTESHGHGRHKHNIACNCYSLFLPRVSLGGETTLDRELTPGLCRGLSPREAIDGNDDDGDDGCLPHRNAGLRLSAVQTLTLVLQLARKNVEAPSARGTAAQRLLAGRRGWLVTWLDDAHHG